jgi:hypothetical protein
MVTRPLFSSFSFQKSSKVHLTYEKQFTVIVVVTSYGSANDHIFSCHPETEPRDLDGENGKEKQRAPVLA